MERRLAAILCADVVGYSRQMGADEAGTLARLKAFEITVVDPTVTQHGGRIVKRMGDGYLVAFTSVVAAVEAALAWQAEALPPLRFRMGIHLGDVIIEGDDLFGDGINVAARLEALAEPGGLCLSEDAQRQVRGALKLPFEDMGEQRLKNIGEPIRVFRLAASGPAAPGTGDDAARTAFRLPKILLAPFRHLGSSGDAEALAAGVTETLASALAHFEELELIDPGCARDLVAERGGLAAGRQLGATYVLEGSLQIALGKVRVGVQLVDALSGRRVWSETVDRSTDDIFALQDDVTAFVASTVGEAVGEEQARAMADLPDAALDPYQLLLRGQQRLHRMTPEDVGVARELFERALRLAPDAYYLTIFLCWTCASTLANGWPSPRPDALDRCLALMRDVLHHHDRSAQAHRLMARLVSLRGDHGEALAQSERALRLNPYNSDMMMSHGYILARAGRAAEGVAVAERTLALNPYAPVFYKSFLAFICFFAGEPEKGLATLWTVQGTVGPSGVMRIACLAALGRLEEARAEARKLLAEMPDFNLDRLIEGCSLASGADRTRLRDALRRAGL
jgi:adenylate cyclase